MMEGYYYQTHSSILQPTVCSAAVPEDTLHEESGQLRPVPRFLA